MKRDEEDVNKVMKVISSWRDPFEESEELVSLSSRCVASESSRQDLLTFKRREQKLLQLLWRTDCCQPPRVSLTHFLS